MKTGKVVGFKRELPSSLYTAIEAEQSTGKVTTSRKYLLKVIYLWTRNNSLLLAF
ncbi:hypothetical protein Q0F98_09465 [Paenibacillus amylolyticus]|nr:hypothetical protein Q0F98_09465 [Paenibacillus amylolyticus]